MLQVESRSAGAASARLLYTTGILAAYAVRFHVKSRPTDHSRSQVNSTRQRRMDDSARLCALGT